MSRQENALSTPAGVIKGTSKRKAIVTGLLPGEGQKTAMNHMELKT
jgi:hypothetical protein